MSVGRLEMLQRVAGDVSRETYERLLLFECRFLEWNKRINLTSESDAQHLWDRHIVDSAQLLSFASTTKSWLDFGSGGGFPGAIIAIMVPKITGATVHLVESNRKKAAFLKRIAIETDAPAIVHACRIETMNGQLPETEIVTARAVSSLPNLLRLARPWLGGSARALFQKGREYRAEIEESRVEWSFDLIEHTSKTDLHSVILELSNLRANCDPAD